MARIRVLAENPPSPRGYVEDQLQALRDYVTRLKDELEFLLTHLGEDNLCSALQEHIRRADADRGQTKAAIEGIREDIAELDAELDDKQSILTFDSAPTEGSLNPVTSGGVFSALPAVSYTAPAGTSQAPRTLDIPLEAGGRYLAVVQRLAQAYALYGIVVQANGTAHLAALVPPGSDGYFTAAVSTLKLSVTAKSSAVTVGLLRFG